MDLVKEYYEDKFGCYPFEDAKYLTKTQLMIEYLQEAGLTFGEILDTIHKATAGEYLCPLDLQDELWENSLLKRDTFYFHKELKITSGMPSLENGISQQYIEMKIKYTLQDLLAYYYKVAQTEEAFKDEKKDIGALQHILKQYEKLSEIEAVDFVLHLIDYAAAEEDISTYDIFYINNKYRSECYNEIKTKAIMAKNLGYSRIIWRQGE